PIDRFSARNGKPLTFWAQFVCLIDPANNLQVYFWHPLPLRRHVQFVDDPVADNSHLREHSTAAFATVGVSYNDGADVSASGDPLSVIPPDREPTRWLFIFNPLRHQPDERLYVRSGDRNRLLPINLLQILLTISGRRNRLRRIRGKITVEVGDDRA